MKLKETYILETSNAETILVLGVHKGKLQIGLHFFHRKVNLYWTREFKLDLNFIHVIKPDQGMLEWPM